MMTRTLRAAGSATLLGALLSAANASAAPPVPRPRDTGPLEVPVEPPKAPQKEVPAWEDQDEAGETIPKTRAGPVLTLAEVLDSVEQRDPRMKSAELGIRGAEGHAKGARGMYDPVVRGRAVVEPVYRNSILDARVEQPTPLWGLTAWAGWQVGVGRRPYYNTTIDTILDVDDRVGSRDVRSTLGTLSAGLTLPLWKDRAIDRRRANIRQSSMERDRMKEVRDAKLLELEVAAATSYWTWVANGLRLEIEETLLALAQKREGALRRRIELGALDPLAGVDNRRLILDREGRVVAAERAFQQAGLDLSLYLRDGAGNPVIPSVDRLPARLPAMADPDNGNIEAEIGAALERRPDRRARLTLRSQADVELRWAKNQRAPKVELSAWVSRYMGRPLLPDFVRTGAVLALVFEIPIPLRYARGQLEATRASAEAIAAELRLLDDTISVEIRDGHQALVAAYRRARLANQEVDLTRQLAAAEYRKFQLGAGDLLLVNLREVASADAAHNEIQAVSDYFVAKAKLEGSLGMGVQPVTP
ncbi:Outer membrane protein TolC [Nannocystis exedens]|uniref:Outer membrane protein TolC n=1 Tax=Nannocystis exedens TaxID=54 RepID=A0A1I2C005_9BACT|nr:TolC family protein [Nannocystis exedens]PCC71160.1 Outer membrane efflux protein [Nannocystis exedens]SFE61575.1 Outer membrane protein TolC [Nannocystis exedens]